MKYNYNNFLKKNYLFVGLLVFAYLFYIINNNNFYESFIIFIILILGYLLINFKIFYILLLLIIISNLFFNFNKLIEGNTSDCPYISDSIKKIVEEQKRKSSLTTTPNSELVKKIEQNSIRDYALNAAKNINEFNELDENSARADISDDCANKMSEPTPYIPQRSYQKSICPQPTPSEILESSVKGVSVEPII
tara:strand:- start:1173 stop:1751 length:579 start_codon:yes stop_codon:yes gene_type:complete